MRIDRTGVWLGDKRIEIAFDQANATTAPDDPAYVLEPLARALEPLSACPGSGAVAPARTAKPVTIEIASELRYGSLLRVLYTLGQSCVQPTALRLSSSPEIVVAVPTATQDLPLDVVTLTKLEIRLARDGKATQFRPKPGETWDRFVERACQPMAARKNPFVIISADLSAPLDKVYSIMRVVTRNNGKQIMLALATKSP